MTLNPTNESEADVTISDAATSNSYTWDGDASIREIAEAYAASYDADFDSPVRIRLVFSDQTVWGSFGADRKFTVDQDRHF